MMNCEKCDKKLAKTTKGNLCNLCYQSRNKDVPHNHRILVEHNSDDDMGIEVKTSIEIERNLSKEENDKHEKLFKNDNDNTNDESEERTIIEFLKVNMINERQKNDQIINILKEQIEFMKKELLHKNNIITTLVTGINIETNSENNNSPIDNIFINRYNSIDNNDPKNYVINNNDNTDKSTPSEIQPSSDFLQMHIIDDTNSEMDINDCFEITSSTEKETGNEHLRKNQRKPIEPFTHIRRPPVLINPYPERDNINYYIPKHYPGNSNYNLMTKQGKKVLILSDSICGGMDIKQLDSSLRNKKVYRKYFPGATPEDLEHFCQRTLEIDKPDIAIINVGMNEIGKKNPFLIAGDIMKVVNKCKQGGCNKIFVSAITHRSDFTDIIDQVNNILRTWEVRYDYKMIFNDNIDDTCISKDKIHLNKKGKTRLRANFRKALNNNLA